MSDKGKKDEGRPKNIPTPEILEDLFEAYCQEVDENPIYKAEPIKSGDMAGTIIQVPLRRPYLWEGFSVFLWRAGILANLDDYKTNKNGAYDEFSSILAKIMDEIRNRNLTGAFAGSFKESITARYHGLSDKQEIKAAVEQPLFPEEPED